MEGAGTLERDKPELSRIVPVESETGQLQQETEALAEDGLQEVPPEGPEQAALLDGDGNPVPLSEEQEEIYSEDGVDLDNPVVIEGSDGPITVYQNDGIDLDLKDASGRTNADRMKDGLAPIDSQGRPYNLHHHDQNPNGPLVEISESTHQSEHGTLHTKGTSEVDHGPEWDKLRQDYWKNRALAT